MSHTSPGDLRSRSRNRCSSRRFQLRSIPAISQVSRHQTVVELVGVIGRRHRIQEPRILQPGSPHTCRSKIRSSPLRRFCSPRFLVSPCLWIGSIPYIAHLSPSRWSAGFGSCARVAVSSALKLFAVLRNPRPCFLSFRIVRLSRDDASASGSRSGSAKEPINRLLRRATTTREGERKRLMFAILRLVGRLVNNNY